MKRAGRDTMLASEVITLKQRLPILMVDLGFKATPNVWDDWLGWSNRFDCSLVATPIYSLGSNPWLACRFERKSLYAPWRMGDPRNFLFRDIQTALGANPFTGKYNCHLSARYSATDVLSHFKQHLLRGIT